MLVNDRTREGLRVRREWRELAADGWEVIGEGGGKLWELYRGGRTSHVITDVRIAPGGKSLWVKIEPRDSLKARAALADKS